MNTKRMYMALIAITILTAQTAIAGAGRGNDFRRPKTGWGAISRAAQTDSNTQSEYSTIEIQSIEPRASASSRLTGTWVIHVPESPGSAAFNALQTYNDDGTMTETSDLLAQLVEGPAHGVWSGKKSDYQVTFELFAFENQQPVGRIRVRVSIHLINDDNLTANAVVDFIDPDGTVIPNIGGSPFSGTRIKVLPVQ